MARQETDFEARRECLLQEYMRACYFGSVEEFLACFSVHFVDESGGQWTDEMDRDYGRYEVSLNAVSSTERCCPSLTDQLCTETGILSAL